MADDLEAMFLGEEGGVEEEEQEVTARVVLAELQEAWRNEKLSPELLPNKSEYVEVMLEQVEQMEDNMESLGEGSDLRKDLHRLELTRIQYVLRSYLRTRLAKIEEYSLWLLKERNSRTELLSSQEANYLKQYSLNLVDVVREHLDKMPTYTSNFNMEQMEVKPELETHVFAKSKVEMAEHLVIEETDEEVVLRGGSQHILPYSAIRDLLLKGEVDLI